MVSDVARAFTSAVNVSAILASSGPYYGQRGIATAWYNLPTGQEVLLDISERVMVMVSRIFYALVVTG